MDVIDPAYQVLYSELAQRSLDAAFSSEFTLDGRFIQMESRGRRYWYFDTAKEGKPGAKNRLYVGPVDDPDVTQRVANFKDLKADYRARRRIVSTLTREARLPRPEQTSGDVVEALANAGFFRVRGVLIGTIAYQCYSALLGIRLPDAAMQTLDADFAQFQSIAIAVGDTIPPVVETLRVVDPTFREVPHQTDGRYVSQYRNRQGYRVEFLTPSVGPETDGPATMPALAGTSAQPLRFLDYLIYQPERAVLLHNAGVPILVPAPERYAVHKLIVASRRQRDRDGSAKSRKDLTQAATLARALVQIRRSMDLGDAFMEAWDRGPHWRDALRLGLREFDPSDVQLLQTSLAGAVAAAKADPAQYELQS